jgi:hypothetical protein
MGALGNYSAADALRYPRGARVIVRTPRGLEIGDVVAPPDPAGFASAQPDGVILRRMTVEDQLLEARLLKKRDAAYDACRRQLADRGIEAVLLDVEHLFDGQTLVFYFLGTPPPEIEALTAELAETYDAAAQFRQFTDTLLAGCGPDCGTEEGGGCKSCSTGCAVAGACSARAARG